MRVHILYDNQHLNHRFQSGWGFSCLVDGRILFDTGESPDSLLHNFEMFGLDLSGIETVVISHDHWDHTGGLWQVLKEAPGLQVMGCPGFRAEFKNKVERLGGNLVEIRDWTDLDSSISVTGEIEGEYGGSAIAEQALVVRTRKGTTIITGCSHPGIVRIVKVVKDARPDDHLSLVLGGFHMKDQDPRSIESTIKELKKLKVEAVGPTHCTGAEAIQRFRNHYGDKVVSIASGKIITI